MRTLVIPARGVYPGFDSLRSVCGGPLHAKHLVNFRVVASFAGFLGVLMAVVSGEAQTAPRGKVPADLPEFTGTGWGGCERCGGRRCSRYVAGPFIAVDGVAWALAGSHYRVHDGAEGVWGATMGCLL